MSRSKQFSLIPLSPEAWEARKPLPPEILADALVDRVHKDLGVYKPGRSVKTGSILIPCPTCAGNGIDFYMDGAAGPCSNCNGKGKVTRIQMKIRHGFVSNSSSASFSILSECLSVRQLKQLEQHLPPDDSDRWDISVCEDTVVGYTDMDNFNMLGFLTEIGVQRKDIEYRSE